VVVTMPGKDPIEVPVTVHVEQEAPKGQDVPAKQGEDLTPKAGDAISNKDKMPEGTTYTWKETPNTSKPGDQTATVVVTMPGKDPIEVPVTIHVDPVVPQGQDIDTKQGEDLSNKAGDAITNKDDMPEGTTYTWKEVPDTTKAGDQTATVIVTLPDGTQMEVNVTIHVEETAKEDNSSAQTPNANETKVDTQKAATNSTNGTDKKAKTLPQTGNAGDELSVLGLAALALTGLLGTGKKRENED
ncbi:MAG: Rib/alpha-like domain-containing protein, partial [Limosilactobacillus sp.]|uniref:Rib/alpha-like domain-containing protein n=1 Tax=Limosilactobacillus sp. TaxID=2773925 RepID=UPI002700EE7D|nr:Rib/alpha-like domain-containing protein [Limosilactobacillus sp.]